MTEPLPGKLGDLRARLREMGSVVVAYSGGVDSALLTALAHEELGDGCLAATAVSPSLARHELDAAKALAARRGWSHVLVATREFEREEYVRNDADRCYWCKTELFDVLEPIAAGRGAVVCLGTNLDDLGDHRPGLRAAAERGARQPLVDAGLTKAEVRRASAQLGLPTHDKPAAPCLSSRVAYGIRVDAQRLRRIERAEAFVRSLGFSDVRVRDLGDRAGIEVPRAEVRRAVALKQRLAAEMESLGFGECEVARDGLVSGRLNLPLVRTR